MQTRHLKLLFLLLGFGPVLCFSQQRFVGKDGHISFFSEAPLENIEAHNREVSSILDLGKKEIAVSVPMRAFQFDKSLMQEHFNENYVESEKFPKATFTGTFKSTVVIDAAKDGVYPVDVEGRLTLHGVTKPITASGTVEIKGGVVIAKTKFTVAVEDYNIEVPTLLVKNIAETVEVSVDLKCLPQKI